jgi:Reverse transcriptase (RNA-dependent DNA polymerase)
LGNQLDVTVRQGQLNQTIGIPVGPDTSRVIGEIIGVGIETILEQSLKEFKHRAQRYVDDLNIGFDENESVEQILSTITKAFSNFELDINIDKTTIFGVGETLAPEWLSPLRRIGVGRVAAQQQDDLEHYLKNALFYADQNPRDQVLVYAIKRSRSFPLANSVWPYYVGFLLRICRKDARCIPVVAQILIESKHRGRPIDINLVEKYVGDTVRRSSETHSYFEVSWALFLAKALRIKVKSKD